MTSNTKELFADALALPPVERASLIEQLLASFDQEVRSAADLRWAAECEARLDAYDAGEIQAHGLDYVAEKINRQ